MPEAATQLQGRTKDREGTQGKHNGEDLEEDKKMLKQHQPKPLKKEGERSEETICMGSENGYRKRR